MYGDVQAQFSDKQSLITTFGTTLDSDNVYDFTAAPRRWGPGKPLLILVQITTAVTSAGAATVQFQLVEASDVGLDSDVSVIAETPVIAKGTLVAGWQFIFMVPVETIGQRYLGLNYVVGTADTTAGAVTAQIVETVQTAKSDWTAEVGR